MRYVEQAEPIFKELVAAYQSLESGNMDVKQYKAKLESMKDDAKKIRDSYEQEWANHQLSDEDMKLSIYQDGIRYGKQMISKPYYYIVQCTTAETIDEIKGFHKSELFGYENKMPKFKAAYNELTKQ